MDWTSIVPTAISGVVGLAGIGGTLLSARMTSKSDSENLRTSIGAEDQRARLAEKCRIYANYLSALSAGFNSYVESSTKQDLAGQKHDEIMARWRDAHVNALSASSEVRLIGPGAVGSLATEIFNLMLRLRREDVELWARTYRDLLAAMRADLGEAD